MTNRANGRISGGKEQTVLSPDPMPSLGTAAPMMAKAETCCADDEWIREDERKRIARDLHDELGQQLLALRIDVILLRDRIAETQPQLQAVVGDVLAQLGTTMQSLRAVIRGLRPVALALGLRAAVESQCTQFIECSGIACDLTWHPGDIVLTDRCATALFRTLQESLTNVHRHAQASRVSITVCIDDDHIVMTVSDNGRGSLPAEHAKTNGFGLSGMQERITALGGKLVFSGAVHEGMTLTVALPV
jgi:signal transduction histidine kinase